MSSSGIQHVLLDADGVLQYLPGDWVEGIRPWLGDRAEAFMREQWGRENASLRGEEDYLELLAAGLRRYGVSASVDEVYPAVWHSIELVPETVALVPRLRAAGFGVHLGTNQERHRASYMRTTLGFDELFDVSVYSWELGVAKPDPAYFTRAAALIGADPATVLFVDDREVNVAGAREAGLAAEQWEVDLGTSDRDVPRLLGLLAAHGVKPD